jgi:hypothetical protein
MNDRRGFAWLVVWWAPPCLPRSSLYTILECNSLPTTSSQSGRDLVLDLICFIYSPPSALRVSDTDMIDCFCLSPMSGTGMQRRQTRPRHPDTRFYLSWGLPSGDLEGFLVLFNLFVLFFFLNCLFFCLLTVLCDVVGTMVCVSLQRWLWIRGGGGDGEEGLALVEWGRAVVLDG